MRISGTTTLLGLIGTPVEHSKSPAMYNHCFQKFGLDWAYLAFNIPQEKAGDAVQAIRTLGMRGANVTMPCKNAVIPYLDKLTPAAEAIQAVNTIVNENGTLVGHTTDGCGYTQNLRRGGVERFRPHHEAAEAQVGGDLLPGDRHSQPGQLGAELPHLPEEQLRVAMGGEGLHLKAVGMQAHQFEGLGADGAGGAENVQGGHDAIPPSTLTWTPAAGSRT